MRSAECGVRSVEMGSVENEECRKCGVWKTWSVENPECGKRGVWKTRSVKEKIYKKVIKRLNEKKTYLTPLPPCADPGKANYC